MINTRVKPHQQRASSIINPRQQISEPNKAAKEAQEAAWKKEKNRKKLEKNQNIERILSIKGEERKQMLSNFANYLNQTSIRTNKPSIVSKLRNKASSNQNFNYNTDKHFWSMIYTDYNSFRKNKEAKRLAKEEQNRLAQKKQQNVGIINTVTSALETAQTAVTTAVKNITNPPPSPVQTVVNNKNAKLRNLVNQTSKEFVNLEGKLKELRGAVGLSPNISAAAEGGSKKKKRSKSKKSKSKSRK